MEKILHQPREMQRVFNMIHATHLTKQYGETLAVDDMSFDIAGGECVGLLGLNGAGKTTLLRMMSCLLTPTSGNLTVDGADVTTDPEAVRPRIGFLPDVPPLYGEMTVREFLGFAARLRQVPTRDVFRRVGNAAEKCALEKVIDQRIDTLSYGYKKRVGIAQAIVHGPPLVILDEPIAGLDPAQIVGIRELVLGLRGDHTILVSSHILTEISQVCDRIFVMHDGRIAASGSEESLSGRLGEALALTIKIKGDQATAVSVVEAVPGVTACRVADTADSVLTLEVSTDSDARARLSRAVIEANLELLELFGKRDQLESVFLSLTGGNGGDA